MSNVKKLEDARGEIFRQMQSLLDTLNADKRGEFTDVEAVLFQQLKAELNFTDDQLDKLYRERDKEKLTMKTVRDVNANTDQENIEQHGHPGGVNGHLNNLAAPDAVWLDSDGNEIKVLSPQQKLASLPSIGRKASGLHFGKILVGLATSRWTGADRERQYLAQSGGVNTAGGYMVPEELAAEILDLARARSVVLRAGARTFEMTTDTLIVAKQTGDPTFTMTGENSEITESELTFGANTFSAKKLAALVTASNELMRDAPNAADTIQNALINALAAELDQQALDGSGSLEFLGLANNTDITATGSVGAIEWLDLHNAAVAVMENNYTPNAYAIHPTIYGDATIQTTGDGTNSAKNWLPPPPIVAAMTPLTTTGIPNSKIVVGQWDQCAFGIRLGLGGEVQFSNVAGTAFEKDQTKFRIVFRGDFLPMRTTAFYRLTGITT
ncbi:MAG: phage major capsid protein [Pirellulales bacterium]